MVDALEATTSSRDELTTLRQHIQELKQLLDAREHAKEEQARQELILREQVRLLDLAHDAILVRSLDGTISFWNLGAERMYGFSKAMAVGRTSHAMLQTVFPAPFQELQETLFKVGFWEGELTHRKLDGTLIIVSSRWVLERGEDGVPRVVLEINNDITARKHLEKERERQAATLQDQVELLDLAHDAIMVRGLDGTISFWNHGAEQMYGFSKDEAIGQKSHVLLQTLFPSPLVELDAAVLNAGYWEGEIVHTRRDRTTVVTASRWVLKRGGPGAPAAVLEINNDITARKRAETEEAHTRLQDEIIRAQADTLRELSTPLIPISDKVLVMPLIGTLDSLRAQQVMDNLLQGMAAAGGEVAIIDITGVPIVDTEVANALLKAARGVRLLGAEVVLTGIRPEVARTLVELGTNIGDITTRNNLQSGITFALNRR